MINLISKTIRMYSTDLITNPWTGKVIKSMTLSKNSIKTMNKNYFPSKFSLNTEFKYTTCTLTGGKTYNKNNTKPDLKHLMSISKYENYKPKRTLLFNSLSQISV